MVVAIDDTLFRRRGKKVWAASWFHDGSAQGPAKTGYGNTWVIAAIVVKLPAAVTWTTRLRKDAALHALPPARADRRGRPRTKGDRLPCLAKLAAATAFTQVTVTRCGKAATISAAAVTCLWPSVFGARQVTVVLIRDRSAAGYDLALVTTDTTATAAQVIERYAARWSIEVTIEDARQVFGAGQARNRTARAVERTIPFQLACQAIATCWYATAGHDPRRRGRTPGPRPWYASKAQPSTADMAAKLRRVIAARFKASRPDQPTPEEISVLRLAWEDLAA